MTDKQNLITKMAGQHDSGHFLLYNISREKAHRSIYMIRAKNGNANDMKKRLATLLVAVVFLL